MVFVWCVVFLRPGYSDNNIVWFVQTHTHIVRTHIYRHLLYPHLKFHFDSISFVLLLAQCTNRTPNPICEYVVFVLRVLGVFIYAPDVRKDPPPARSSVG